MAVDERVEVVRYRPARRRLLWLSLLALALLAIAASFLLGTHVTVQRYDELLQREQALRVERDALARRNQELEQQVVNLQRGADVDREVIEEVRQAMHDYRQQIARLEEEITFFKGLMAPGSEAVGLDIHSFTVQRTELASRYDFKLLLRQVAKEHGVIQGYATVTLVGDGESGPLELPLSELSSEVEDERIKLRFRYFQAVEGSLDLPEGFRPRQVALAARASGRQPQEVDKLLDWSPRDP